MNSRIIFFHKTATSGRTRFMKYDNGGVCGPEPLPTLAQIMSAPEENKVAVHPSRLLQAASEYMGLPVDELETETEFHQWVDIANGPVEVFLVRFTAIDPPFAQAQDRGASFIELSEARNLQPVQLELLREAYECVMTG